MPEHEPTTEGILASVRRMIETALRSVQNRVELFALELQEEKAWLISTLLWAAAAVFFGGLAIIFVVGTIVYLSPENARPWVLGGFALLFVYLAVNAIIGLRRSMENKKPPLSDTIGELKKDIEWIQSRD
jgi:uncharacterized membrane protein YqjE